MPLLCEKYSALCAEKVNQPCVVQNQSITLRLKCSTIQGNKVLLACASIFMYLLYLINIFL